MSDGLLLLAGTAASIGVIHTVIGPDHYVPFIMMASVQGWSRARTLTVTVLCGIGHVLSSVVIGMAGIALGVALHRLEYIESLRGDIAAWALVAFGLLYGLWGLRRAWSRSEHEHEHRHEDGTEHSHGHAHLFGAKHESALHAKSVMTTWTLFTIFVLGPCEPLIPLLMFPAARDSWAGLLLVTAVFAVATIGTMTAMVLAVSSGLRALPLRALERFTHAIAGGVIALSGLAILFLGL